MSGFNSTKDGRSIAEDKVAFEDESVKDGGQTIRFMTFEDKDTTSTSVPTRESDGYTPPSMFRAFINCLLAFLIIFIALKLCDSVQRYMKCILERGVEYSESYKASLGWSLPNVFTRE